MHIFLSYSRADLKDAEQIAVNLKQAGHQVFFDRHNIKVSEDFNRVIWGEIQKAELFIFLVSPNSVRTGCYALTELSLAEKKWPNPEGIILPVVIKAIALNEIPIYVSICHMLQPAGNVAAEVRAAVKDLHKRHRRKKLRQAAAAISGLVVIGLIMTLGYREYLDRGPLIARTKLAEMNLPYNQASFVDRAFRGDLDAINYYLAAGMDPNAVDIEGNAALIKAIDGEHFDVVIALIEANVDVNARKIDTIELKALGWAASRGQESTVRALLEAGSDTAAVNEAAIAAAESGHLPVLQILVNRDAGQPAINSAFVEASRWGNTEIIDYLLDKISDRPEVATEALLRATGQSRVNLILGRTVAIQIKNLEYLLNSGAIVNGKDEDGSTPLISVVEAGIPELVKLLLEKGADPNIRCECYRISGGGWTPLTLSFFRTSNKTKNSLVNLLLASGADVNLAKKDGVTALMLAAEEGDLPLVQKLLDKGADGNARNEQGQTALSKAIKRKQEDVIAVLLSNGADQKSVENP